MDEYIDKEAFKKSVEERYCLPCKVAGKDYNGCKCRACWVDDMLDEVIDAPAADVAPVVHGRWIKDNDSFQINDYCCYFDHTCSECGKIINDRYEFPNYCPNCGAKMDELVGNSDRLEENKE